MEALERLQAYVASTERNRRSLEAPLALTSAYLALIFGYAWARLGDHERGRKAVAIANALIKQPDRVHEYLVAAFAARIEDAIVGRPEGALFSETITAQYKSLNRVARYKVNRMRDMSRVLEPNLTDGDDAANAWMTKTYSSPPVDPPVTSIRALRASTEIAASSSDPILIATCDAIRGRWDLARPVLDENRERHNAGNMAMPDRLTLGRALAEAYGEAPLLDGMAGIQNLAIVWPTITDSYGTNSHFCLSVIAFVEPLVLALVRLATARAPTTTPSPRGRIPG